MDLGVLSKKAEIDVSRLSIEDLAHSRFVQGKVYPVVKFFELSSNTKVMMSSLSKLSDSVLLRRFWRENGNRALEHAKEGSECNELLGVNDVEELIWTPSKEKLQFLVERFLKGTISFEEVDKYFNLFCEKQGLVKEIKLITSQNDEVSELLINQRIEEIYQYYELQNCIDAAQSILEFKTKVGLEGNFQLVEDLKNQVCCLYTSSCLYFFILFSTFQSKWLKSDSCFCIIGELLYTTNGTYWELA